TSSWCPEAAVSRETNAMGRSGQGASGLDLALAMWSRRKLLATLVFTGTLVGAITIVASLPSIYRAAATVLVERQQVAETFVRSSVTGELETRLQTISQETLSRARLSVSWLMVCSRVSSSPVTEDLTKVSATCWRSTRTVAAAR